MARRNNLVQGVMIGAGLMYMLDPDRGRRRRAMMRDQVVRAWSGLDDAVDTTARDLKNRARGVVAETRSRLSGEGEVSEQVLEARVRTAIGRAVSHPSAIEVRGDAGGCVVLSGPVLAHEVDQLLSTVEGVRGVEGVVNDLEVHMEAGNVSALQGAGRPPLQRSELRQENWAPAIRFLAGMGGGMMSLYGRRLGGPVGSLMSVVGLGVVARAATNLRFSRLTGLRGGRRAIDLQKAINVDAPVQEVFEFFSHFENFPRFMAHIKDVKRTGDGAWHWVARGPGGVGVEWDAIVTRSVPNQEIAWKSVEGATLANTGIAQFQPNESGGTRVNIRLSYNPPGGAIGHAVASFFGVDPKKAMDEDLVRFKSLIEQGKTSAHGETVEREDLGAFPAGFRAESGGIHPQH